MAEQPTCGQGLAANSPLRTKLGELVGSTAGVLEIHMASLDPGDEATEPERRAYQRLAAERELLAMLQRRVEQDERMLGQMRAAGGY